MSKKLNKLNKLNKLTRRQRLKHLEKQYKRLEAKHNDLAAYISNYVADQSQTTDWKPKTPTQAETPQEDRYATTRQAHEESLQDPRVGTFTN